MKITFKIDGRVTVASRRVQIGGSRRTIAARGRDSLAAVTTLARKIQRARASARKEARS